MLEARGLTRRFGDKTAVDDVSFEVADGQMTGFIGGNGAGKTTTLSLFLGFIAPSAGQVRVRGTDPTAHAEEARRALAYIPENVALYEHLSARENVSYLLALAGQSPEDAAIDASLAAAGLAADAFDRRVAGFSKGMRQKVAIGLALARRVPVLLLDEPTSGLDPQATAEFNRLLGVLRSQGVAVLMVTHDLLGAADVADRIGFLDAGRLVEEVAAAGADRFDVRALHRRYGGQAA